MEKVNRLTPVRFSRKSSCNNNKYWVFKCDCGKEKEIRADNVLSGKIKSCGCVLRKIGGISRHPVYNTWRMMIRRCYDWLSDAYSSYGGRGIEVCEEWRFDFQAFAKFVESLGPRPKGNTLDRIRVDEGYKPDNLRWASAKQQRHNQREYLQKHGAK
jgi:hypothetical protein